MSVHIEWVATEDDEPIRLRAGYVFVGIDWARDAPNPCRACTGRVMALAPDINGHASVAHRCHGALHHTFASPTEGAVERWNRLNPLPREPQERPHAL